MKRILPLLLVVLLLASTMCMTASASSVYVFEGYESVFLVDNPPDPGYYHLYLYMGSDYLKGFSNSPVFLDFDDGFSKTFPVGFFSIYHDSDECYYLSDWDFFFDYFPESPIGGYVDLYYSYDGLEYHVGDGFNLQVELVPASSSSSISDIVTSDMLTGSMDHIVDLLPVVLVVIVSFLGIRKGISFLQQLVRSA